MKHIIMIDEQVDVTICGEFQGTDSVAIWEMHESLFRPNTKSFLDYLKRGYPDYEWELDDGDDWNTDGSTDYCQYVVYLNNKKSHCLLASYHLK